MEKNYFFLVMSAEENDLRYNLRILWIGRVDLFNGKTGREEDREIIFHLYLMLLIFVSCLVKSSFFRMFIFFTHPLAKDHGELDVPY